MTAVADDDGKVTGAQLMRIVVDEGRLYPPTTVQKIGPYFCRFACVQSRFGSFKVSLPLSKQFGCTGWCARLLRV
jgi:hypothetical protein